MANLWHDWGGDLVQSSTGSLLLADGSDESRQRVLRRLLTKVGDYIWHVPTASDPGYGGGLPAKVGSVGDPKAVQGLIIAQMLRESGVARNPAPIVNVSPISNGIFVDIQYWDVSTGEAVPLTFSINV